MNLPYIADATGPKLYEHPLTRAKLESLVEEHGEPFYRATESCAGCWPVVSDINDVILVGGQTRHANSSEKVAGSLVRPVKTLADEAVAIGAAARFQGGVLTGDVKDVLLLDVTPLSLSIETMGGVMTA